MSTNGNQLTEFINYFPEAILEFKTLTDIVKQFPNIIKENIMFNILKGKSQYICCSSRNYYWEKGFRGRVPEKRFVQING